MKHTPFQSIYRPDFEVVEERQGSFRLYPHTEQLPLLWRALHLEFQTALPGHIARVYRRPDDFRKILLRHAALMFCHTMNGARPDGMRLLAIEDSELITRVAIAQQITEHTRQGAVHRFRFYAGPDFFPEIRLSGWRVAFADHVLQRFSARVPNNVGEDLSVFLLALFGAPHVALPVGPGHALVMQYGDSILAFPFRLNDDELFVTTCLTVREINSLSIEVPPLVFNPHYGERFRVPRVRHWLPMKHMLTLHDAWEQKIPLAPPRATRRVVAKGWYWLANHIRDFQTKRGHGPLSRLVFTDHVPGPCCMELLPGKQEPRVNELELYKQERPDLDWEAIFTEREESMRPKPAAVAAHAPAAESRSSLSL